MTKSEENACDKTQKNLGGTVLNQATYVYDDLDRRICVDDNSMQTWIVFDGQNPYADFTGSDSLATRYLSGSAIDESKGEILNIEAI